MSLFESVLQQLRARDRPLEQVATGSGVPYFTLQKWLRRRGTRNPRVESVQKVADWFAAEKARQAAQAP